jgi:hypothetical protein
MLKKAINGLLFLFLINLLPAAHAAAPDWLRTLAQQPAKNASM